jgi:hypothetical protein
MGVFMTCAAFLKILCENEDSVLGRSHSPPEQLSDMSIFPREVARDSLEAHQDTGIVAPKVIQNSLVTPRNTRATLI